MASSNCDLPEDWPWSSYQAMLGRIAPPPWLHVRRLMTQFGNSPQAAAAAYVDYVRAGVDLPSVWERLQGQIYLGDAEFVEETGNKIGSDFCLVLSGTAIHLAVSKLKQ